MARVATSAIYVRGTDRRPVHVDAILRLPHWDELICRGCATPLSYCSASLRNPACFKHLPSTSSIIKEGCKYYLGGEDIDDDGLAEASEHKITLSLTVERNTRGQAWQLNLRLPQASDAQGTVRIRSGKRGSIRQLNLEALQETARDYRISPNAGKLQDELSFAYVIALKTSSIEISTQRAYLFPETRQPISALAASAELGGRYYAVSRNDLLYPTALTVEAMKTDAAAEDYAGWSCSRITLPHAADDTLIAWFSEHFRLPTRPASCRIEVLYPPCVDEGRDFGVTRILPNSNILIALDRVPGEAHVVLAYSEDPEHSEFTELSMGQRSSAVVIESGTRGHLAIGFARETDEKNWRVAHYLRPISPYTPVLPTICFASESGPIWLVIADERVEEYLKLVRQGRCSISQIAMPRAMGLKVLSRTPTEHIWSDVAEVLTHPQQFTAVLRDRRIELRIELAGLIVAEIPCERPLLVRDAGIAPRRCNLVQRSWVQFAAARQLQRIRPVALPAWSAQGRTE